MNNYKDILDAMQIYGKKLDAVHVGWIDKDGIEIKDFVRLVWWNDLEVVLIRQMAEREISRTIPYSDIRSIHGVQLPSRVFEHDEVEIDVEVEDKDDTLLNVHTEIIGTDEDMINFSHVTEVLKRLMNVYGFRSENDRHTTLTENKKTLDWYLRLQEFIQIAYDYKVGWKIAERMGIKENRAIEWKRKLVNTIRSFIKNGRVNKNDKDVLSVIYNKLKTNKTVISNDDKSVSIINHSIKNTNEISLLRKLMFESEEAFKPHASRLESYYKFVDMKLEEEAISAINKVTGTPLRTLYGWEAKTRNNLIHFNSICHDERLEKISKVFS